MTGDSVGFGWNPPRFERVSRCSSSRFGVSRNPLCRAGDDLGLSRRSICVWERGDVSGDKSRRGGGFRRSEFVRDETGLLLGPFVVLCASVLGGLLACRREERWRGGVDSNVGDSNGSFEKEGEASGTLLRLGGEEAERRGDLAIPVELVRVDLSGEGGRRVEGDDGEASVPA